MRRNHVCTVVWTILHVVFSLVSLYDTIYDTPHGSLAFCVSSLYIPINLSRLILSRG